MYRQVKYSIIEILLVRSMSVYFSNIRQYKFTYECFFISQDFSEARIPLSHKVLHSLLNVEWKNTNKASKDKFIRQFSSVRIKLMNICKIRPSYEEKFQPTKIKKPKTNHNKKDPMKNPKMIYDKNIYLKS